MAKAVVELLILISTLWIFLSQIFMPIVKKQPLFPLFRRCSKEQKQFEQYEEDCEKQMEQIIEQIERMWRNKP